MKITEIGVEMWFRADRPLHFTVKQQRAMQWWLERRVKAEHPDAQLLDDVRCIGPTRAEPDDPISCRTYYGDRTWRWGMHPDGQVRGGGGVRAKVVRP